MTNLRCFVAAFAGASLLASVALADPPPGKGQGKGKAKGKSGDAVSAPSAPAARPEGNLDDASLVSLHFAPEHERIIRDWFGHDDNLAGLPPGLAKRDRLPPGLEKQLVRNGTLPPGLEKKLHPLPSALSARLPSLPDGYRRRILGESVIVIDERTSAIIDVLHGAARIAATL